MLTSLRQVFSRPPPAAPLIRPRRLSSSRSRTRWPSSIERNRLLHIWLATAATWRRHASSSRAWYRSSSLPWISRISWLERSLAGLLAALDADLLRSLQRPHRDCNKSVAMSQRCVRKGFRHLFFLHSAALLIPSPSPQRALPRGLPNEGRPGFCHKQGFGCARGPPTCLMKKFAQNSLLGDQGPSPSLLSFSAASMRGRISVQRRALPSTWEATALARGLSRRSGAP